LKQDSMYIDAVNAPLSNLMIYFFRSIWLPWWWGCLYGE